MIVIGLFQTGVDITPYIPTTYSTFDYTNATNLASGIASATKPIIIANAATVDALRFISTYSPVYILLVHNYPPVKVLTTQKLSHFQTNSKNFFSLEFDLTDLETQVGEVFAKIESMENTQITKDAQIIQKKIDLRMYGEER